MLTIIDPSTTSQLDQVRELCWEYRSHLLGLGPKNEEIILLFYPEEKYARLMDALEAEHSPPTGSIKLVLRDGEPVGCGMYHTLMPGAAEIKRVFVRDSARGLGVGRRLMQILIDQCRTDGFSRILMDTAAALEPAINLYLSLGFQLRGPYQDIPEFAVDRMQFFEMDLRRTRPACSPGLQQ